jgi:hypothetical protein
MFFLPHPVLPRGEGEKDFSPTGRKEEGLIFMIQSQRDYTFVKNAFDAMATFNKPIRFSKPYWFGDGINLYDLCLANCRIIESVQPRSAKK